VVKRHADVRADGYHPPRVGQVENSLLPLDHPPVCLESGPDPLYQRARQFAISLHGVRTMAEEIARPSRLGGGDCLAREGAPARLAEIRGGASSRRSAVPSGKEAVRRMTIPGTRTSRADQTSTGTPSDRLGFKDSLRIHRSKRTPRGTRNTGCPDWGSIRTARVPACYAASERELEEFRGGSSDEPHRDAVRHRAAEERILERTVAAGKSVRGG
jgi:hypothetical protein